MLHHGILGFAAIHKLQPLPMTSISPIETVIPRSFSSLSSSPSASVANHDVTRLADGTGPTKNKGKEREVDIQSDEFEGSEAEQTMETASYPPMNDDETETRRVEEASQALLRERKPIDLSPTAEPQAMGSG